MRKILLLTALILAPAVLFAQTNAQQNEAGTTYLPNAGSINSNIAVDRALRQIVSLNAGTAAASNPIALEDAPIATGQALVMVGSTRNDALSVTAGTDRDAMELKSDIVGRLIITDAPAGETGTSCSAEVTNTTSTVIVGNLASNRFYVRSITCSNNSAVASRLTFQDGSGGTAKAVGAVGTLAATGGGFTATFPTPIRLTVNTGLFFAPTTTATATICCATGFYSVN